MTCASARGLLEAYLDRELDVSGQAAIQEHLEGCPACAEEYSRLQAVGASLRTHAQYYKAPAQLQERIFTAVRAAQTSTRATPALPWRRLAVAASVLLGCSLAWNIFSLRSREELAPQEVLSSHLRSLAGTHLLDVPSSDQHTVKPWFNGKLDFSPDVKDLAIQGFPLIGGRIEYLDARPAAALVYRRRQHIINLFIRPRSGSSTQELTRNGFNIEEWTARGVSYWAVSDLSRVELRQFVELYREN